MNISVMLDIGIGLIIIYLAGAVLVSAIQELIASLLQWRSQHLKESILQMMLNTRPKEKDDSRITKTEEELQFAIAEKKSQFAVAEKLQKNIYNSSLVQSMNHTSVNFWSQFTSEHKQGKKNVLDNKYENLLAKTDPSYSGIHMSEG